MKKVLKKGFTLIELLVVIAIIAILATVIIINVTGARAKAAKAQVEANMSVAAKIAAACYSFTGSSAKINLSTASMVGGTAICSAVLADVGDQTELDSATGNWPVLPANFVYLAGVVTTGYAIVNGPATGAVDTLNVTTTGIVKSGTW